MKLYIAGPMQGVKDFNFPLFNLVADQLRAAGHEVFNPAERDLERHNGVNIANETGSVAQAQAEHGFSLRDALADDTQFICKEADGIVMLPGWEYSNGALAEWNLARALKKVYPNYGIFYMDTPK
jgi:Domain of unknown function (DUF4406)